MELNSVFINPRYTTIDDDPYHDFFLPCFANSNNYCRYGGFFTSKNLALCAEGIEEFIKNKGTMQLVLTPIFTKEDIDAIKQGLITKEKKIEDDWIKSLDSIKEKFEQNHVKALSWMISREPILLEIKIAIFKDEQGNLLDVESIKKTALADTSVGIFHDDHGHAVSYNGIIKAGIEGEDHIDITVHKSWLHKEHVDSDYDRFRRLWEQSDDLLEESENSATLDILDLPEAAKQKLLDLKPRSIEELELKKSPRLRSYQKVARDSWIKHGGRGIFEMATGTGKTIIAISCIKEISQNNEKLFVTIACPTKILVEQWTKELKKWDFDSDNTLKGKKEWKKKLQKTITNFKFGTNLKNLAIIITTYDSFHEADLVNEIKKLDMSKMLICDEVHSAGAETRQQGLLDEYNFRLGLSATPERYFDDEGTEVLRNFFKPTIECNNCPEHRSTVFKMDLKEAIERKILSPYNYYPEYVELIEKELKNYKELTRKIAVESNKKVSDRNEELLAILNNQRANILKNAANKIPILEQITNQRKNLDYCLIYCAPKLNESYEQIKIAQDILNKIPIPNSIIKSDITKDSERQKIIEQIESGLLKCVLAIRILDEGIDIPPLKTAIIMASDGNPKQFIQRRGRILRKWPGTYSDGSKKEFAEIYDIFVIPTFHPKIDLEFMKTERKIVEKELKRHNEMVEISRNPEFGLEKINKIRKLYDV